MTQYDYNFSETQMSKVSILFYFIIIISFERLCC